MPSEFTVRIPETRLHQGPLADSAAHFGIATQQYVTSLPPIGMQTLEIVQQGKVIRTGYSAENTWHEFDSEQTLKHAYRHKSNVMTFRAGDSDVSPYCAITALVPDHLQQYVDSRDISINTLLVLGIEITAFASAHAGKFGDRLFTVRQRPGRFGSVAMDSISFGVSSGNMLAMHVRPTSLTRKLADSWTCIMGSSPSAYKRIQDS